MQRLWQQEGRLMVHQAHCGGLKPGWAGLAARALRRVSESSSAISAACIVSRSFARPPQPGNTLSANASSSCGRVAGALRQADETARERTQILSYKCLQTLLGGEIESDALYNRQV
jgi:hypothetical protein